MIVACVEVFTQPREKVPISARVLAMMPLGHGSQHSPTARVATHAPPTPTYKLQQKANRTRLVLGHVHRQAYPNVNVVNSSRLLGSIKPIGQL
jgi:UDP-2,3-diacylglucosamine pyrophosphatase LpxH